MDYTEKIDLHMHTLVSDGTDSPSGIVKCVKNAGITLFSVTDHDAIKGCAEIVNTLSAGDPAFIFGVEFSCKDQDGQYHILGYGYDKDAPSICKVVETGHNLRMEKLKKRLDFIEKEFGFAFSENDREKLFTMYNPGKPHIGNMMVEYGYAPTLSVAIDKYLNKCVVKSEYVRPEEAIEGILSAGGIPVLAHPSYGRGDELFIGEDMEKRVKKLVGKGLRGVEAFYSGFTAPLQNEILALADKYDLYVTAGSDYHGGNKLVPLGDTNLKGKEEYPKGLTKFLSDVNIYYPERAGKKQKGDDKMLTINKKIDGTTACFTLLGRLDTTTVQQLETELKEIIDGITDLQFDFENLEYISSAGLRVLLSAQKIMNGKGKMKIAKVKPAVMEIFEVTGFTEILTIE